MVSIKFCFYGIELLWLCFHRLFFTWLGNCSQPICTQLSLVPASQCSLCKTNDVFQLIRTQLNDSLIGSIKRLIISFRRLECDQLFGFFHRTNVIRFRRWTKAASTCLSATQIGPYRIFWLQLVLVRSFFPSYCQLVDGLLFSLWTEKSNQETKNRFIFFVLWCGIGQLVSFLPFLIQKPTIREISLFEPWLISFVQGQAQLKHFLLLKNLYLEVFNLKSFTILSGLPFIDAFGNFLRTCLGACLTQNLSGIIASLLCRN